MAEAEPQPKRERKSAVMTSRNDDIDVEKGEDDERLKKQSYIISEEEIQGLRKQDMPHPQAPIRGICIAVGICCLITIICVPSAFAAVKKGW